MKKSIDQLIIHFKTQNISVVSLSVSEIENRCREQRLILPLDFVALYSNVNGMKDLYPNEMDEEGFLFYPLEHVTKAQGLDHPDQAKKSEVFIFAEYMHKSWWYGCKIHSEENYTIGILPTLDSFVGITNKLNRFIDLYLQDSPALYAY